MATLPALALVLSLAGTASLAQPVGGSKPPRDGLTPEQRQKIFPEQRRLTLQDHRARIAILQRGESCINGATSPDALRDCMRVQREAMWQQRRQHMSDMRNLYVRNGLPMPQWRRLEKPQGPRPGGPGSGAGTEI
ncbi:MAG: hypothetical protein RLZZ117_284 [Cyanobacteriota bacterium]|jgi:hypothetical protein